MFDSVLSDDMDEWILMNCMDFTQLNVNGLLICHISSPCTYSNYTIGQIYFALCRPYYFN